MTPIGGGLLASMADTMKISIMPPTLNAKFATDSPTSDVCMSY